MLDDEEQHKLSALFHPYAVDESKRVERDNVRFVHYTSAEAAVSILKNRTVWMRDSRVMNDFSEIEYGLNRLSKAYRGPIGDRLKRCLEGAASGITDEIVQRFEGWSQRFTKCTYLACVSEHAPTEDLHGRLSMWRAYGGRTSVALVMNNRPFFSTSDVLKAYASPVLYADQDRFDREFERVTQGIEPLGAMLRMMGRESLRDRIFNVFLFAALCTKHPGFHEEQEWRVIHAAEMHPSKHLAKDLEVVRGAPQFVYKIPLKDIDDEGGRHRVLGSRGTRPVGPRDHWPVRRRPRGVGRVRPPTRAGRCSGPGRAGFCFGDSASQLTDTPQSRTRVSTKLFCDRLEPPPTFD
jgi:hypothetical protein